VNKVAQMPARERADLFAETAERKVLPEAIIEKDFWVCWMLKQLFLIEALSGRLLFKGGTSLSKIFHAISRSRGPCADHSSHFVQRLVWPSSGSEPVRAFEKILLVNGIQYFKRRLLHDLILQSRNREWSLFPVFLQDIDPTQRLGLILAILEPLVESLNVSRSVPFIRFIRDAVHSRAGLLS
jgi:hypothetical protein